MMQPSQRSSAVASACARVSGLAVSLACLALASCGVPDVEFFSADTEGGIGASVVDATVPDAGTGDAAGATDAAGETDTMTTPVTDGGADAPNEAGTLLADAPLLCVDGGPAPDSGICCGDVPCFGCTKCNKCTKVCNEGEACCTQDSGAIACVLLSASCD